MPLTRNNITIGIVGILVITVTLVQTTYSTISIYLSTPPAEVHQHNLQTQPQPYEQISTLQAKVEELEAKLDLVESFFGGRQVTRPTPMIPGMLTAPNTVGNGSSVSNLYSTFNMIGEEAVAEREPKVAAVEKIATTIVEKAVAVTVAVEKAAAATATAAEPRVTSDGLATGSANKDASAATDHLLPTRHNTTIQRTNGFQKWVIGWPNNVDLPGTGSFKQNALGRKVLGPPFPGDSNRLRQFNVDNINATVDVQNVSVEETPPKCSSWYKGKCLPWHSGKFAELVRPSGCSVNLWKRRSNAVAPHLWQPTHGLPNFDRIDTTIESTWNSAPFYVNSQSNVFRDFKLSKNSKVTKVIASDLGSWKVTSECPTPKAWLFLYGHWRTWDFTRGSQKDAFSLATDNCYFVVAALWPSVGASENDHGIVHDMLAPESPQRSLKGAKTGRVRREDMLRISKTFGGRMSFAVLSRTFETFGKKGASIFTTGIPWVACWQLARAAAKIHGFEIDPFSPVIRTRPDIIFTSSFDWSPLHRVFERGTNDGIDGSHVSLGTIEGKDVFIVTSFVGYETDIALPYLLGLRTAGDMGELLIRIGMSNSLTFGQIDWDRRLRPPMQMAYSLPGGLWLGDICRISTVTPANMAKHKGKDPASVLPCAVQADRVLRKIDITKHVMEFTKTEDAPKWRGCTACHPPTLARPDDGNRSLRETVGKPCFQFWPRQDNYWHESGNKITGHSSFYEHGLSAMHVQRNLTDWVSPMVGGQPRTKNNELRCQMTPLHIFAKPETHYAKPGPKKSICTVPIDR